MERALDLVRDEFCVASGAKLNRNKCKILCPTVLADEADIQDSLYNLCLRGSDWVKSLGGVYSPDVKPEHKFDAILDKIHKKMVILQRRYPSLTARVLLANSLLSSCLWYFAYFIPPTAKQLKLCDSKV